jgi:hypothetical protein
VPITTSAVMGEDVLAAGPDLRLLHLVEAQGTEALATLLEEAPLYRINLEMLLDTALLARAREPHLAALLEDAYAPDALPGTLPHPPGAGPEHLRHPMLAHMHPGALARFYAGFIARLAESGAEEAGLLEAYGFAHVLHKNRTRLLEHWDGYTQGPRGAAALAPLLLTAQRPEDSAEGLPSDPMDCYLDLTLRQYHRAQTVDRVLSLGLGPKAPAWVLEDVRTLLAWEEQKRAAAQDLARVGAHRKAGAALTAAIERDSTGGHVSPVLTRLVAETLGAGVGHPPYSGSAGAFVRELAALAGAREDERR